MLLCLKQMLVVVSISCHKPKQKLERANQKIQNQYCLGPKIGDSPVIEKIIYFPKLNIQTMHD